MISRELINAAADIVVSIGVGAIGGHAVKMTTPTNAHLLKKASMMVGGFVLSNMVSESALEYSNRKINDMADKVNDFKNRNNEVKEEEN